LVRQSNADKINKFKILKTLIYFLTFLQMFLMAGVAISTEKNDVIEYLKFIQDEFSEDKKLVPSMEDNYAHTFNNALAAIAFILENEKERAERVLDFYSQATIKNNEDITLQNFFFIKENQEDFINK